MTGSSPGPSLNADPRDPTLTPNVDPDAPKLTSTVAPDPPGMPPEIPRTGCRAFIWTAASHLAVISVGSLSKLWLQGLNSPRVYGLDKWLACVEKREAGRPLITVSNHFSMADDPLLFGLLPFRVLLRPRLMRWGFGASDICFTRPSHGTFFALGKVVPVIRGAGVYQRGVDVLLERLDAGDWVHVFPEGKVNLTQELSRLKWGVGRLVAEASTPPLLLPFWHEGMDEVLPVERPYWPRVGRRVTVVFGDVVDTRDLLETLKSQPHTAESLRKDVTDYIQAELKKLRDKAKNLHVPIESREPEPGQEPTVPIGLSQEKSSEV